MKKHLFNEALQGVKFKGFPDVSWDCILHREAIIAECGFRHNTLKSFAAALFHSFADKERQYKLTQNEKSNILCFQSYFSRKSCVDQYRSICSLYHANALSCESEKYEFHIISGFAVLFKLMPAWWMVLRRCKMSLSQKMFALKELVRLWHFHQNIKDMIQQVKDTKLLITYYDSLPEECFVVTLFKGMDVPTVTLQHGQFSAWRENIPENSGIEFRTSASDYFLCWNRFTMDEAKKEGVEPQKLVLAGIIGFLNSENLKCKIPGNNTFGVVIGHPMFEEENRKLIESANILANKCNLKYWLKLHPNYDGNHFDDIVDQNCCLGNMKKGIPMIDYANSVDFSIVGSSSVFVELVYLEHPTLRYSSNDIKDKFRDVHIGKVFSSPNEIVDVFTSEDNNSTASLFDYLCSIKDVKKGYLDFLNRFHNIVKC